MTDLGVEFVKAVKKRTRYCDTRYLLFDRYDVYLLKKPEGVEEEELYPAAHMISFERFYLFENAIGIVPC